MGVLIEARNITKTFYKGKLAIKAVDQVSFTVKEGECLGVVGESGSGKSTVARLLAQLLVLDSGEIYLEGREISRLRGRERRRLYEEIQMVFQTPFSSFDPKRTFGESIREFLKTEGLKKRKEKEEIRQLLESVELDEAIANRYPYQVSGGQCQRAALARALAKSPRLLICDEVTSALDVTVQVQIMELLKKMQREHSLSLFFICHDLAVVQNFCDRVLVMYKGRVVEEGTPDEVIQNPKQEYTRQLIESAF